MKRHSPAASRNREPIAQVLREELPAEGLVLELASGTGEHAAHFARAFPRLEWQPSDADAGALSSIAAWRDDELAAGAGANLRSPIRLDVCGADWPQERVVAILAVNLVHISPPNVSEALFEGAGRVLAPEAPLILYGPFVEEEVETAPTNREFDISLKMRDPIWGLRRVAWLDELADGNGMRLVRRTAMPANNLMLVYRRNLDPPPMAR